MRSAGADESDPLAALDGFDLERDRQVGLAGADRTGDHEVLAALEIVAGGELGELGPLDPAQCVPVELVQGLVVGEAGTTATGRKRRATEPSRRTRTSASSSCNKNAS